jgi:uncharacterized protein (TIGR00725 family)
VICVIGSGSEPWTDLAGSLGRMLASLGVHLLTGGGQGVMESVSRAFHETSARAGCVIGVIPGSVDPGFTYSAKPGYPNAYVEIVIRTHLPLSGEQGTDLMSRNHINVLSADGIIALPGGLGTISEAQLAVRYRKPILLFGPPEAFDAFPPSIERTGDLSRVTSVMRSWAGRVAIA